MQASGPGSSCGNRDAIEAEAARLLARLNSDPSSQDEADICAWIESDPRHAVAFARAEAAWEAAERLKSAAADVTLPPMAQIVSEEQQRRLSRNILVAAAVAVMLFIVAAIVTVRTFSGVDRYETGIGQMRDIALSDGSILHLNSDSQAEVRFTDNGRKVRILKGEASFEVAHDKARPFDVEARSAVIRAVGTAFNVRMRPSIVELTVTQGTVTVHSGGSVGQKVAAGSGAVIQPRSIALTHLGAKLIGQRVAWREQMVELDGETIDQAASEFNRYRAAPILIGDTRVSALRIGGRFRTTDSREFLSALQFSLPIRVVDGEDGSVMLLYRDEEPASAGNAVSD
ncbi:FecR domain-containing protein [Sphingobium sp. HBC34]|uniref:FecR domain-containing protein n=1 Tax=Sphingobium cyanobacteriorum TaxID=3063954 RepID=A0ABT8ZTN4_9SPHN|nr:FecR domain-containing protein [Sphingobium sp. HBC34]MDO7837339.1 FecR domain-containing protein [Sphingobium sp. HBC34]